jgi:hypothetical protein
MVCGCTLSVQVAMRCITVWFCMGPRMSCERMFFVPCVCLTLRCVDEMKRIPLANVTNTAKRQKTRKEIGLGEEGEQGKEKRRVAHSTHADALPLNSENSHVHHSDGPSQGAKGETLLQAVQSVRPYHPPIPPLFRRSHIPHAVPTGRCRPGASVAGCRRGRGPG